MKRGPGLWQSSLQELWVRVVAWFFKGSRVQGSGVEVSVCQRGTGTLAGFFGRGVALGHRGKVVKGWCHLQDYCNRHLFLSHSSVFLCVHVGYGAQMGASGCT